MQLNLIVDLCVACSKLKRSCAKSDKIDQIGALMLDRIQISIGSIVDSEEKSFLVRATAHDDLVEFFLELEESCYICRSHGGNMAIVANEVDNHLRERIEMRKQIEKETNDLINEKSKQSRRFKVLFLKKQEVIGIKPGPFNKNE
jgi:hypothetical protein